MSRKKKVETIKKRLDSVVKTFENEIAKIEAEDDVNIYHFHYIDIIYRDGKAYVFPIKGKTTIPYGDIMEKEYEKRSQKQKKN